MLIGRGAVDIRLVDVVGPHRVERRHIPRHAGHETRQQRRQAQAQDSGGEVVQQHVRNRQVVIEFDHPVFVDQGLACAGINFGRDQSLAFDRRPRVGSGQTGEVLCRQRDGNQARQNDKKGKQHFRKRRNQGCAPCGTHRIRRHRALDDQKIRAPVAERQDKAQAHGQAEPLDAQRVGMGVSQSHPGMSVSRSQLRLEPGPATDVLQPQPY